MPVIEAVEAATSSNKSRNANWFVWVIRTGLAILEQALIAGSNFLLNVLVARWLTAEQYGAYAFAFAVYMLMIGVYQGLILEPMSVLSASYDEDRFRSYLGSLLRLQLWISALLTVCLGVIVLGIFAFQRVSFIGWTLLGLAPSLPFILVFWLLRAACYVRRRPQDATQSAFIYSVVLLASLTAVRQFFHLSSSMVFIVMGASAAVTSVILLKRLRPRFRSAMSDREEWLEHWRFGRWELSKIGFDWIYQNVSYTLTAGFMGIAEVGALKAIMTLFLPLTQSMAAVRRLILPHLASDSDNKGSQETVNSVWKLSALYLAGGLVYAVLISAGAKPLFRLLFAGKFMEYSYLVPWAAVASLFGLPGHVIDMGLRAIRSPKSIFVASSLSAICCVCVTVPLTWAFAIRGAVASIVISSAVLLVIIAVIFRRKSRERVQSRVTDPLSVALSE